VVDPNDCFADFVEYFGLSSFDFGSASESDLNVVGKAYEPGADHRAVLPDKDRSFLDAVFAPLTEALWMKAEATDA
jgi:hypothetical protein